MCNALLQPRIPNKTSYAPCTIIYFFTVFAMLNSANRSGVSYAPEGLGLSLEARSDGLGVFFWPVDVSAGLTEDDLRWFDAAAGDLGDAAKEPGVDVLFGRLGIDRLLNGLACLAVLLNPARFPGRVGGCFFCTGRGCGVAAILAFSLPLRRPFRVLVLGGLSPTGP
jgi:hypothetical protein